MNNDFNMMNFDSDGDGINDSYYTQTDMNYDGINETEVLYIDTNNDGIFDSSISDYVQTDAYGNDVIYEQQMIDTNGDGVIDTVVFGADSNYDGIFDSVQVFADANGDGELELVDMEYTPLEDGSVVLLPGDDIVQNFNVDDDNIDYAKIVGEPGQDMEHWEFQGTTNRCNLYAQKFVIEELTGEEIDIEEFETIAEENGWFDNGTPPQFMNKMLDYYEVDNEMTYDNDMNDITECLSNGGKIIVAVDGNEIWDASHDSNIFAPNDANHAIEIIGVDNSDPEHPMVIINDSGTPDGCGEMVPLDQFMGAWEDSGYQMIAAY